MGEGVLPTIATQLRELRETAGMSQQSLAVAAGLSVSVVSQIEQGARADPRISTVSQVLSRAVRGVFAGIIKIKGQTLCAIR